MDSYLRSLKNQEYTTSLQNASTFKNEKKSILAKELIHLITTREIDSIDISRITNEDDIIYLQTLYNAYVYRYQDIQDNLEAYKLFLKALKIAENENNTLKKQNALIGILDVFASEIFIGSKMYLNYLEQFTELNTDVYDDVLIFNYNIIFSSKANEDLWVEDSYISFTNALEQIYKNVPASHPLYTYYYREKALQARLKEDLISSNSYFEKALKTLENDTYRNELKSDILWQIAFNHYQDENYEIAYEYLINKIGYSKKLKNQFYNERLKAYILSEEKKYDSAYYFLRKTIDMEYKIGYQNNSLESSILSVENQTEKLKNDKLIINNQRRKNQNIALGLGGSLVAVSIIAFLVYRNTKRKQRIAEQDRELQIQKTETILKEKEIETINAMISGQEKERLRLASELHDNLGSTLATVRMQVENLERNLDKVDDPKALLQKTNALVNEAYTKVRSISHERNSGVLAKDGLLPAIQKLANTVSSNNNLQIEVQDFGLENRIANELEITIFRIIQELVTNIIKHAQATEANISLTQHDNELNIMIEDNGKGFKVGKLKEKDGMGLGSIERRVEHLEGTMEVDSALGRGTSISIDIPL
ncbi:sensor histidine kinase [Dokdonia pacifica]|nr:sensor histidine kinase [Dokdonia pacifica]